MNISSQDLVPFFKFVDCYSYEFSVIIGQNSTTKVVYLLFFDFYDLVSSFETRSQIPTRVWCVLLIIKWNDVERVISLHRRSGLIVWQSSHDKHFLASTKLHIEFWFMELSSLGFTCFFTLLWLVSFFFSSHLCCPSSTYSLYPLADLAFILVSALTLENRWNIYISMISPFRIQFYWE